MTASANLRERARAFATSGSLPRAAGAEDTVDDALRFPLTDTGNAERFAHQHHAHVRYIFERGVWLVWDGTCWVEDRSGEIDQLVKAAVRAIPQEAVGLSGDDYARVLKWAATSESANRRKAMLELARSEAGIPVTVDELDADPWLLNVANGTLDLQTGELRSHDPVDLLTRLIPVAYDPAAVCPTFLAFLDRIFAGDADLIAYMQRMLGYSLTGSIREQVLFIAHGSGANGKSTLFGTISTLLADYATQADTESFMTRERDGIREDVAALDGPRFVTASETSDGRRLSEAFVKKATGGEKMRARRLYENGYNFEPRFKLWLSTNHRPQITGTDHAIWRRIRLIPFTVTIREGERDRELPAKLAAELPGILAWLVAGCQAWQAIGEQPPAAVMQATATYRYDMDALGTWLEDRCVMESGARVPAAELYADYIAFCRAAGEEALTQRTFGTRLTERGFGQDKTARARYRTGLRLRDAETRTQGALDDGCDGTEDGWSDYSSSENAHDGADLRATVDASDGCDAMSGTPSRKPFSRQIPARSVTSVIPSHQEALHPCPDCGAPMANRYRCEACIAVARRRDAAQKPPHSVAP